MTQINPSFCFDLLSKREEEKKEEENKAGVVNGIL